MGTGAAPSAAATSPWPSHRGARRLRSVTAVVPAACGSRASQRPAQSTRSASVTATHAAGVCVSSGSPVTVSTARSESRCLRNSHSCDPWNPPRES